MGGSNGFAMVSNQLLRRSLRGAVRRFKEFVGEDIFQPAKPPRILELVEERERQINNAMEVVKGERAEAERLLAEQKNALAEARREAAEMMRRNKEQMDRFREELRPDPLIISKQVWAGSGNHNMLLIAGLARATRARRYLEIGAYRGFTCGFVRWANPGLEIHAIDNWQRVATSPQELVTGVARLSGDAKNVFVYEGDSTEQLERLIQRGMTFDLIYVDGCHTYEYAKSDLEMSLKLLDAEGTIILDDTVTWWGPRELSEEIQNNGGLPGFQLLELTTSNGLLILRKQLKKKPDLALTRENCPDGLWNDAWPLTEDP